MAISNKILYATLEELSLDPLNPRLGRGNSGRDVTQERVLELMKDWTLEELAVSYLESGGFWAQEALLVTKEKLYGKSCKVVVEGNRRLAALIYLKNALDGKPTNRTWKEIAHSGKPNKDLFSKIPYIEADSRSDVQSFLGFRHVTGIKQWNPTEKAEFIARLIDENGLSYESVMRKIGSRTPSVRQNYIAYRMLIQIQDRVDAVPLDLIEERFSVMKLSLRTNGVQKYLGVDILADPKAAKKPVSRNRLEALGNYARWIFGTEERPPLFTDSRQIDDFGKILESKTAVEYLERDKTPRFELAFRMSGGDETEVVRLIEEAADKIEMSLTRVYAHRKSAKIVRAVRRTGEGAFGLLEFFPEIRDDLNSKKGK